MSPLYWVFLGIVLVLAVLPSLIAPCGFRRGTPLRRREGPRPTVPTARVHRSD